MHTFRINSEIPVPTNCLMQYRGIAFDGTHFYLTRPDSCQVLKFNEQFHQVGCYDVGRKYTSICYDSQDNCFWASAEDCYYKVLKLNTIFQEIDYLTIRPCDKCGGVICGISYNCEDDSILVALANCIVCIKKDGSCSPYIQQEHYKLWNTSVLSLSPGYLFSYMKDCKQHIAICSSDDKIVKKIRISSNFLIQGMVFDPCTTNDIHHCNIFILVSKHGCYPYVLKWELEPSELDIDINMCNFRICDYH
ncbi:MAG: hypothetical protein RR444_04995 [Oscillospiraceae bacterium]